MKEWKAFFKIGWIVTVRIIYLMGLVLAAPSIEVGGQDRGHIELISVKRVESSLGLNAGANPMSESTWQFSGPNVDIASLSTPLPTVLSFDCTALQTNGPPNTASSYCDLRVDLTIVEASQAMVPWHLVSATGVTDVKKGLNRATVALSTAFPTSVLIRLRLSMIVTDPDLFPSGNYASTVTTSITSN